MRDTGSVQHGNGYTKVYKIIKQGEGIIPYIITVENGIEEAWKEIEKLESVAVRCHSGAVSVVSLWLVSQI